MASPPSFFLGLSYSYLWASIHIDIISYEWIQYTWLYSYSTEDTPTLFQHVHPYDDAESRVKSVTVLTLTSSKKKSKEVVLNSIKSSRFSNLHISTTFNRLYSKSHMSRCITHSISVATLPSVNYLNSKAHKHIDLTCERGSVGQSEGLLIPRSSVRFRLKIRELKFPCIWTA